VDSLHEYLSKESLPDWLGGDLTDEEAFNHKLIEDLMSPQRELWYRNICRNKIDKNDKIN
jgi:hypothetical protein